MNKKKNILIINSMSEDSLLFTDFINELHEKNDSNIHIFSSSATFLNEFRDKKIFYKKMYFGPSLNHGYLKSLFFLILFPLMLIRFYIILLSFKRKKNIKTLICLNWNEKILFAPLAKLLKLKNIWIELPGENYKKISKIIIKLYNINARRVKIIALSDFAKTSLGSQILGTKSDKIKIKIISFGIKLNQYNHQENIFSSLAKNQNQNMPKKYFTVGTIAEFKHPNQIENLFRAIQICLTTIPNLQLILSGDGPDKKNLTWVAKKMDIGNVVWFVGVQSYAKKWLDNFDIFIAVNEEPKLPNIKIILKAMDSELPIIGFRNKGFEEIIIEEKTGFLIETNNSEVLAQKIIRFNQDKRLKKIMGENAKELVDKNFSLEKQSAILQSEL